MALTLLAGPANAGKVALLLERYLDALAREPVLIVPNRSDVDRVELELLASCGALLGGQIGTFDDLFRRLARDGGEHRPVATDAQRALIVRRALARAPLNGWTRSARFAGFADALSSTLGELESGLVDPSELARPRIEELPPRPEVRPPALAHLERGLFSGRTSQAPQVDGALRFFEGAGRRGTLERVAEELLALIRAGTSPEKIALVCPRVERYRAPLETALGSLGVPYAIEGQVRFDQTELGRALLSLLRFAWQGGGRGQLYGFLRSPYSGLARASVDWVEGRLRGRAAETGERTEEETIRPGDGPPLPPLELLRKAHTPLAALLDLARFMLRAAHGLESPPVGEESRQDLRAFEALKRLVGELDGWLALGGSLTPDEIVAALERAPVRGAGQGESGRVDVVDLLRARTRRYEIVFVLSLEEGTLPRRGEGSPFLDEEAAHALAQANGWERQLDRALRAFERPTRLTHPLVLEELRKKANFGVTELETFADCSSIWFVDRLIGPRTIDQVVDPRLRGQIAHSALHKFFAGVPKRLGVEKLGAEQLDDALEHMHECLSEAMAGVRMELTDLQRRELEQGLLRDLEAFLRDEAASELQLVPRRFEVSFGSERSPQELQRGLDLGTFTLSGKIDRIDLDPFSARGIVQDYKSGKTAHSAAQIESELKLQIPLYMLVLRDLIGIEPLGGIYRALAGKRDARGLLRAEAKEDAVPGFSRNDYLEEEAFWGQVDRAQDLARGFVGRIRDGDVRHDPKGGDCPPWCEIWRMCRVRRA